WHLADGLARARAGRLDRLAALEREYRALANQRVRPRVGRAARWAAPARSPQCARPGAGRRHLLGGWRRIVRAPHRPARPGDRRRAARLPLVAKFAHARPGPTDA